MEKFTTMNLILFFIALFSSCRASHLNRIRNSNLSDSFSPMLKCLLDLEMNPDGLRICLQSLINEFSVSGNEFSSYQEVLKYLTSGALFEEKTLSSEDIEKEVNTFVDDVMNKISKGELNLEEELKDLSNKCVNWAKHGSINQLRMKKDKKDFSFEITNRFQNIFNRLKINFIKDHKEYYQSLIDYENQEDWEVLGKREADTCKLYFQNIRILLYSGHEIQEFLIELILLSDSDSVDFMSHYKEINLRCDSLIASLGLSLKNNSKDNLRVLTNAIGFDLAFLKKNASDGSLSHKIEFYNHLFKKLIQVYLGLERFEESFDIIQSFLKQSSIIKFPASENEFTSFLKEINESKIDNYLSGYPKRILDLSSKMMLADFIVNLPNDQLNFKDQKNLFKIHYPTLTELSNEQFNWINFINKYLLSNLKTSFGETKYMLGLFDDLFEFIGRLPLVDLTEDNFYQNFDAYLASKGGIGTIDDQVDIVIRRILNFYNNIDKEITIAIQISESLTRRLKVELLKKSDDSLAGYLSMLVQNHKNAEKRKIINALNEIRSERTEEAEDSRSKLLKELEELKQAYSLQEDKEKMITHFLRLLEKGYTFEPIHSKKLII
jgi:hypothetical protein